MAMPPLLSSDAAERLRMHAQSRIGAGDAPGIAVAVTGRDGAESLLAVGNADLAGTPLGPDHRFEIGSISKSFAAICALQLEIEGALSLDDRLVEHLPWFRVGGGHGPITLRHLLMHRSGLPLGADPGPSSPAHIAELADAETEWEPGSRFWYSNVGYDTLGYALELRAGLPLPEIIRRRVLEPLGMHASRAHIDAEDRCLLADGHERLHPQLPRHPSHSLLATASFTVSEGASGSIVSTPADMARYVRHLLGRRPVGFDRMIEGLPDDEGIPYGLGLAITDRGGHQVVGHSGGMVGYVAQMLCDMDAGVGAIALSNGPAGARTVAEYALDLARAEHEGADLPDAPGDPAVDLSAYAGRYGPVTVSASGIEAGRLDGTLFEHAADTYSTDHPELCGTFIRFGRSAGERVDHLIAGDDWYPAATYAGPTEFAHPSEWEAYPGLYRSHNPWLPVVRITLCRGELAAEQPDFGHMPLVPHPTGGFAWTTPDGPLPERFRFDTLVDRRAQRLDVGGCRLYRAMRS
jgi:CubicO group peptidase (beta-lactamase class C family)